MNILYWKNSATVGSGNTYNNSGFLCSIVSGEEQLWQFWSTANIHEAVKFTFN